MSLCWCILGAIARGSNIVFQRSVCVVFTAHHGHVTGVRYTSDGLFIVSSGSDNKLKLWNAVTGKNTMVSTCHILTVSHP